MTTIPRLMYGSSWVADAAGQGDEGFVLWTTDETGAPVMSVAAGLLGADERPGMAAPVRPGVRAEIRPADGGGLSCVVVLASGREFPTAVAPVFADVVRRRRRLVLALGLAPDPHDAMTGARADEYVQAHADFVRLVLVPAVVFSAGEDAGEVRYRIEPGSATDQALEVFAAAAHGGPGVSAEVAAAVDRADVGHMVALGARAAAWPAGVPTDPVGRAAWYGGLA